MDKINDTVETLDKIYEKYGITQPVPEELFIKSRKDKRRGLIEILKAKGTYTVWYGAVMYVYFIFKSLGIGLSIAQSAVFLTVASMTAAAGTVAGSYVLAKDVIIPYLEEQQTAPVEIKDQVKIIEPEKPVIVEKKKQVVTKKHFTLNIGIRSDSINQNELSPMRQRIINYFLKNNLTVSSKYGVYCTADYTGDNTIRAEIKLLEIKTMKNLYMNMKELQNIYELEKFYLEESIKISVFSELK